MKLLNPDRKMIVLTLMCLMSYGCCSTEIIRVKPPEVFLQHTPDPIPEGKTYGDMISHCLKLREAMELCNADKASLREWVNDE